jgi:hypothetical protein
LFLPAGKDDSRTVSIHGELLLPEVMASCGGTTLVNSLFANNRADYGAINHLRSPLTILNSTIAENVAAIRGGGATTFDPPGLFIKNSILWANRDAERMVGVSQVAHLGTIEPQMQFSCIQGAKGVFQGEGVIDRDPLFAGNEVGRFGLSFDHLHRRR